MSKRDYAFECCLLLLALSLGVVLCCGPGGGSMFMPPVSEYHRLMVEATDDISRIGQGQNN